MVKATELPPIPDGHPHNYPVPPGSIWKYPMPTQPTIDLRDWFAGMAMQGLLADSSIHGTHAEIANNAYGFADAMIKQREAK